MVVNDSEHRGASSEKRIEKPDDFASVLFIKVNYVRIQSNHVGKY
jgi:hypothetical protein